MTWRPAIAKLPLARYGTRGSFFGGRNFFRMVLFSGLTLCGRALSGSPILAANF
jgi:hypothetical protein